MRSGEVVLGATMTSAASLTIGEAATAAAEQLVPTMPTTAISPTIRLAPARPPSGEHMESMPSPSSMFLPDDGTEVLHCELDTAPRDPSRVQGHR